MAHDSGETHLVRVDTLEVEALGVIVRDEDLGGLVEEVGGFRARVEVC